MKMRLIVLVISLFGLAATNAYSATTASDKSIKELMSLTGAGNLGVQMMQAMLPELKKMVPQAPESFWVDLMNEVNPNDIEAMILPVYRKYFSEEEIQDVIKFYKSPTGVKLIQTLPQVMQESMAVGQQWGESLAQKVIERAKQLEKQSP
jgi:uncharacterized protein